MPLIEKGKVIGHENWGFDPEASVDYPTYQSNPTSNVVITLLPEQDLSGFAEYSQLVSVIIIPFDSFADGRIFSVSQQLRQSYNYTGKIVLSGPMIADQYGFALQCGADAILVPDEIIARQPIELWREALRLLPIKKNKRPGKTPIRVQHKPSAHSLNRLNEIYADKSSEERLRFVLSDSAFGRTAVVSSFGAESAVLLHLVANINPDMPILFIDTEKHFQETLEYKRTLTSYLGLTNVTSIHPKRQDLGSRDAEGILYLSNTTACCHLRKVMPLQEALSQFDTWISGRKSFQNDVRKTLPLFEESNQHIKINPLIDWSHAQLRAYAVEHQLPEHPLVGQGYSSVGCHHCTTPTVAGELPRAGRWRDEDRTECGIHFSNGKAHRVSSSTTEEPINLMGNVTSEDVVWANWVY